MQPELQPLIHELEGLHAEMLALVQENLPVLGQIHPENQSGATNLLHYLALRRHDVRGLQDQLTTLGLSSLGRTESNVLSSVRAVMTILSSLRQGEPLRLPDDGSGCSRDQGRQLLLSGFRKLTNQSPFSHSASVSERVFRRPCPSGESFAPGNGRSTNSRSCG